MHATQIQNITSSGLVYTDEDGNEARIDFSQCYANYIERNSQPEYLKQMRESNHWNHADKEEYLEGLKEWREVAAGSVDGFRWSDSPVNGPCLEFYTQPPVRFVFASEDKFYEGWGTLKRFGWRTIDLSQLVHVKWNEIGTYGR